MRPHPRPIDSIVFGGHDVTDTPLVKSAHALRRDVGPLNLHDLAEQFAPLCRHVLSAA